jgi:hypothetical protein
MEKLRRMRKGKSKCSNCTNWLKSKTFPTEWCLYLCVKASANYDGNKCTHYKRKKYKRRN